jgi:hypothetical protein
MRKRAWTIELRSNPQPDGLERLGRAVKLLLDQGHDKKGAEEPKTRPAEVSAGRERADA